MTKDRTRHGRREVAERLRGVTKEELQYVFLEEILNSAVGGRCFDDEGHIDNGLILNRLADLIDPTCEVESVEPIKAGEFNQAIGSAFHLTCGHTAWRACTDEPPVYCEECGARVVSDDGE